MTQRVQAVERALYLLEEVVKSPTPLTAADLARSAGVNRATTWRLLNTLAHFGLVVRDDSGRHHPGSGLVRLAAAAGTTDLIRASRPTLEWLASTTGGAAYLETAGRGGLVVLDEVRAAGPVQIDLAGLEVPLHCGSVGKLHLSTWSTAEFDDYVAAGLESFTDSTITDPETLRAEVVAAGHEGVAVNYQEHSNEWCGVSSVVLDAAGRHLAYLNVTLPTWTTSLDRLLAMRPVLLQAAHAISQRLAAPAPQLVD